MSFFIFKFCLHYVVFLEQRGKHWLGNDSEKTNGTMLSDVFVGFSAVLKSSSLFLFNTLSSSGLSGLQARSGLDGNLQVSSWTVVSLVTLWRDKWGGLQQWIILWLARCPPVFHTSFSFNFSNLRNVGRSGEDGIRCICQIRGGCVN